jgi:uncharacterized protein (DUF58 family)
VSGAPPHRGTAPAAAPAAAKPAPGAGLHPLRWRPAPRARRLATVALLALLTAMATGRAPLLLIAAPALTVLAAAPRGHRPDEIEAGAAVSATRCFEGEEFELQVTVRSAERLDEIAMRLVIPAAFELAGGAAAQAAAAGTCAHGRWPLCARRRGCHRPAAVRIVCRSAGGMWQAAVDVVPAAVEVFPAARAHASLVPVDLLRRIGEHTGRAIGEGAEFAGIRAYVPGDLLRDINWTVTSRRGRLHVNQRAAERAADLVVMIDAFSHAGPPGGSTLDLAVHGAAALATAYLRIGDRVGAVTLGGMLRWLAPAAHGQQFYRIVETVFDVRTDSVVTPDLDRIPRTALPPGALAVVFSPLLDDRALRAVADLRERRFPLVVVDVLNAEPPVRRPGPAGALVLRLWRLDRAALRHSLADQGIPVVPWNGPDSLDTALAPLRRVPIAARRRP